MSSHLPAKPANLTPKPNSSGGTVIKIPVTPTAPRQGGGASGTAGGKK